MKFLNPVLLTLAWTLTCQGADLELSSVEDGVSPNGKFEIFFSSAQSKIVVKDKATSHIIGSISPHIHDEGKDYYLVDFGFTECAYSDPRNDDSSIGSNVTVSWSPNSDAVAITWNVHLPSSCSILVLNDRGVFVEADFPSYQEMTGYSEPGAKTMAYQRSSDLVASRLVRWSEEGTFTYNFNLLPEPGYTANDPLSHTVELTINRLWSRLTIAAEREHDGGLKGLQP